MTKADNTIGTPPRRGIVLAGGSGTRLYPLTTSVSKQLLAVYDKPMIYYPISCLMLAGISEILIISTPTDTPQFERLLGDGSQWGMKFSYEVQPEPKGIAQAFVIGEPFIDGGHAALILGDNLFYGQGFQQTLATASRRQTGATIFGYQVRDPERYGVVEFDESGKAKTIEEKPTKPKSRYAVPGLYFYDDQVSEFARAIRPSNRGELEITELNQMYLRRDQLHVERFSRGFTWLDAGTHDSLAEAANFVMAVEKRQGLKIGCPEEIAYRKGWIDASQVQRLAEQIPNDYGNYLLSVIDSETTGR